MMKTLGFLGLENNLKNFEIPLQVLNIDKKYCANIINHSQLQNMLKTLNLALAYCQYLYHELKLNLKKYI